jgi:hypothetical protein
MSITDVSGAVSWVGGGGSFLCASVFIHICGMLCGTLCIMHEEVLKIKVTRSETCMAGTLSDLDVHGTWVV